MRMKVVPLLFLKMSFCDFDSFVIFAPMRTLKITVLVGHLTISSSHK